MLLFECHYDTVIFDVDSTLVTVEGIDELARLKGVSELVAPLTTLAMNGQISLEVVFLKRLDLIKPSYEDILQLVDIYHTNLVPGVLEVIERLHALGTTVCLVSGSYNPALSLFAERLGISHANVYANHLEFDKAGNYLNISSSSVLWKKNGKKMVIDHIVKQNTGKTLFVGDGMSDLEAAGSVDSFVCFAGVEQRTKVIEQVTQVVYEPSMLGLCRFLAPTATTSADSLQNYLVRSQY